MSIDTVFAIFILLFGICAEVVGLVEENPRLQDFGSALITVWIAFFILTALTERNAS